jgi:hypothetical protein
MRMDITPYVEALRRDLITAAEAGGEDVRASAERLALALDPAVRLAFFEALSQAAAEITRDLPAGGSVEVRLHGREPQFVIEAPVPAEPAPSGDEDAEIDEDGAVARITLRLPEGLKTKAEEAASGRGQSLNTWLVNAVRAATRDRAVDVDLDISSMPLLPTPPLPFGQGRRGTGKRMTGWAR